MKPSLMHPLTERRHARRRRAGAMPSPAVASPAAEPPALSPQQPAAAQPAQNWSIGRARRAGGPVDNAAYSCACGYMFSAAVTTTVSCPHCGCGQAW